MRIYTVQPQKGCGYPQVYFGEVVDLFWNYLLVIFYLLLQSSGFRFLVLPFCLQHSEKLGDSLVDCIRSLGDLHVLDDYLIFLDPV